MCVEVWFLRNIAETPFEGAQIVADVLPIEQNLAGRRLQQAGEHLDRGALAGAIGSDITQNFAAPDLKADVRDGGNSPVVLGQAANFKHGAARQTGTRLRRESA